MKALHNNSNHISGSIPSQNGQLEYHNDDGNTSTLERLIIGHNDITGTIPNEISRIDYGQ